MKEKQQNQAAGDDQRQGARKSTLKGGQIIYSGHNCTMDCAVYDLSETGAKIRPADSFNCPPSFTLKLTTGETYHCKKIWQTKDKLGVVFES